MTEFSSPAPPSIGHPFFRSPLTLCAHRGNSVEFPENTIPAFLSAAELGVDCIETDVHLTRDGHCVVSHDPTVDRATGSRGPISDYSLDEIKQLDAGYGFTADGGQSFPFRGRGIAIPALAEVLRVLPGMRLNIDLKNPSREITDAFIETVRKAGAVERVLGASFFTRPLRMLRKRLPELATSFSKGEAAALLLRRYSGTLRLPPKPAGLTLQVPEYYGKLRVVTPGLIHALHRRSIAVQVWTVNEERDMERLLGMGVDGIMTDDPAKLRSVLERR